MLDIHCGALEQMKELASVALGSPSEPALMQAFVSHLSGLVKACMHEATALMQVLYPAQLTCPAFLLPLVPTTEPQVLLDACPGGVLPQAIVDHAQALLNGPNNSLNANLLKRCICITGAVPGFKFKDRTDRLPPMYLRLYSEDIRSSTKVNFNLYRNSNTDRVNRELLAVEQLVGLDEAEARVLRDTPGLLPASVTEGVQDYLERAMASRVELIGQEAQDLVKGARGGGGAVAAAAWG
jgi:hypothetical protein